MGTVVSRRHLRIYYFDDYGQPIDKAPLLSVLMPATRMPFNRKRRARDFCGTSHAMRRELAARLALREARFRTPGFWGVFVLVCPDPRRAAYRSKRGKTPGLQVYLTPGNAYMGSYAAISPMGKVVVGDIMIDRLKRALDEATGFVREVMMRKPGETDKRFLGA